MNCPHCNQPIPPELVIKARQSEIAKRPRKPMDGRKKYPRPGAIGLVRNPSGKKKEETK